MLRPSVFFFLALLLAAGIAFWPTYFTRLGAMASWRPHLHGALMFAWCLLLVVQAGLVRQGLGPWHRRLGRLAWVLLPALVLSTVWVQHEALRRDGARLSAEALYFTWVVCGLLVAFTVAGTLALVHRHTPALHARYMACTALPMIDPVLFRILDVHLAVGIPLGQMLTYGLTDAVLLALCWLDRQRPYRVFHGMLGLFVLVQLPTFFIHRTAAWAALVKAFAALPLS